mmetsp:Transcript_10165/g.31692  ORF Transcript_10165/g.31692 Transcript_10165/m.31692 type:complete len:168 (-) Transcript_10165:104-607(-)
MRRCGDIPESLLRLQPHAREAGAKDFVEVHHSDVFYANFSALLRVAEKLGIYTLPPSPNKFAPKSLMRFDNLDLEASLGGLNLGRSHLFATALGAPAKPLQVLLTDAARSRQKPVTLPIRSIAEVLAQAKQRLNLRRRHTSVADASGRAVDDARLASLEDGALLVVA